MKLFLATSESSNRGSINPLRYKGRKTEGLAVVAYLVCKGVAIYYTKERIGPLQSRSPNNNRILSNKIYISLRTGRTGISRGRR